MVSRFRSKLGLQVFCRNYAIPPIYLKTQSHSCRTGESCSVISSEFLNALLCKLVLYIKRLPRLFQVEVFIKDRFAGSLVLKPFVRHRQILARPQFQDFRGHGCKLTLKNETVEQMFKT